MQTTLAQSILQDEMGTLFNFSPLDQPKHGDYVPVLVG